MPFKETRAVDERAKFVLEVLECGLSVTEACERHGISRPTGYKWLERYRHSGVLSLADLSRAPKHRPQSTPADVASELVELKEANPNWGPKKIRALWIAAHPGKSAPSSSTIGDILKKNGLVKPARRRRRLEPVSAPLASATGPNALWTTDFKGEFVLGNGQMCYPLTVQDAYSRFLLMIHGLAGTAVVPAREQFERLFRERGLPERMRSDNGVPFATGHGLGLTRLSTWWLKLGITLERTEPGHPEQNGRHERMHLTVKEETTRPAAADMQRQQERFDVFRLEFNVVRPHEALGQLTPHSVYEPSGRLWDGTTPEPVYPLADITRRINKNGFMKMNGKELFVSEVLAHEPVGLLEIADGVWKVSFATVDIGLYDQRRGVFGRYSDVMATQDAKESH